MATMSSMEISDAPGWTPEEERTIEAIQQADGVDRMEAIRRMQRRRYGYRQQRDGAAARLRAWFKRHQPETCRTLYGDEKTEGRFCRNPNCTQGEHGQPARIDHLRADARFCSEACKKQARRSPDRQKPARNRQCLCGVKRDKTASLAYPSGSEALAL